MDTPTKTDAKRRSDGKWVAGYKAGPGRAKGQPNGITRDIRAMIAKALEGAGGVDYLMEQAHENPSAFLTLVGKIVPAAVKAEITGADGRPLMPAVHIGQALAIMLGNRDNAPQNDNTVLPRSVDAEAERLLIVGNAGPPVRPAS